MLVRTPSDLGLLIRTRRRELGLDQRTLAARVGVSRLWIIEFERGKPRAEIGLVLRTLAALDLDLDVAVAAAEEKASAIKPPPDIDAVVRAARKPARRAR
jgi:HTH-type transcriptional regulator/antitoxin HipB